MATKRKRAKEGPGSPSAEERWKETVKGWLRQKTTLEVVEARDVQRFKEENEKARILGHRTGGIPERPGGFKHKEWAKFRAQFQKGDELWIFSSPKETWAGLCGRAGFAIVRDGEVVDVFVSVLN